MKRGASRGNYGRAIAYFGYRFNCAALRCETRGESGVLGLPMTAKLRVLTSLRFFAAVLVFVQHVVPLTSRFSLGGAGVAFFFILSGFILTYVYGNELGGTRANGSVTRFYIARIARIYPIYIVGFVLSLLEVVYRRRSRLDGRVHRTAMDADVDRTRARAKLVSADADTFRHQFARLDDL